MSFTLRDIESAMVEKITSHSDVIFFQDEQKYLKTDEQQRIFGEGFNKGVEAQSSIRLRMNRENLAVILGSELCKSWAKYVHFYGQPPHGTENQILALLELGTLDGIIAADKDIVEVDK